MDSDAVAAIRKAARRTLNSVLGSIGFQLVRFGEKDHVRSFLPFKRTLKKAREAGLSLTDFVDQTYQALGATQGIVDQMVKFGVLSKATQKVCEIGPGTGRYLEKVVQLCSPRSYEIYETEQEWCDWLSRTYPVKAHDADGKSLRQTANNSMDLVHSHRVFVYIPSIVTCQYFSEMIRVTRPGGQIVFDIISEDCMDDPTIERWIARETYYPITMPRHFVLGFFARRQCSLRASFFAPLGAGRSEYLAFVKEEEGHSPEPISTRTTR